MISWISYTTAKVSNSHQGIDQRMGSTEQVEGNVPTNCETFLTTGGNGGAIFLVPIQVTTCQSTTTSSSAYDIRDRFGRTDEAGGRIQHIKNSTIINGVAITAAKKKVTQMTTTLSTIQGGGGGTRTTTQGTTNFSRYWTTKTLETNSSNSKSILFFESFRTGTQIQGTRIIDLTRTTIVLTSKETIEFITYTDLPENQTVVEHTIYEDSRGLSFFSVSAEQNLINANEIEIYNSANTGWDAVTAATLSTATRITEFYKPVYIEISFSDAETFMTPVGVNWQNSPQTITQYGLFSFSYKEVSELRNERSPLAPFSTIKTQLVSDAFPFTTTGIPEDWDELENGEYGIPIYSVNELEPVVTSRTQASFLFQQIEYNTSTFRTLDAFFNIGPRTRSETNGRTLKGPWYQIEKNSIGFRISSQTIAPNVYFPFFYDGYGSPDLSFTKSTFSETPLFLNLQGAEITINDFPRSLARVGVYRGVGAFNIISAPFAIPSFTAYAKPIESFTDEDGYTYTALETIVTKWTSVTINRTGKTFASSWKWNQNETEASSSSGTAELVEEIQIPTHAFGFNPELFNIRGGANFPHRSFTVQKIPQILHKTIYDGTSSSTESTKDLNYSVFTTVTRSGDEKITISSYLPQIKGGGVRFTFWPQEVT
jgi:hypothetical protein